MSTHMMVGNTSLGFEYNMYRISVCRLDFICSKVGDSLIIEGGERKSVLDAIEERSR